MWKSCSDCCYLDTGNAKCDGVYKCGRKGNYANASTTACEQFVKSYGRNSYERQKLHELGEDANNKTDSSVGTLAFILVILIVALCITKTLGY